MIHTLLAVFPALAAPADLQVEWNADGAYVAGKPFPVEVSITAGPEGASIPLWLVGAGAFEKDGTPLGPRSEGMVGLPSGAEMNLSYDLGPSIGETGPFSLGFATGYSERAPLQVRAFAPFTDATVNFMDVPVETLGQYAVRMETNRGAMIFELWPDVAPNHVRNFLDLNHRGFYEGTIFHRVSPSFMIQGGDGAMRIGGSSRWTGGSAPRNVNAEFNDRKHVRGVLSAARSQDINSATSQFFVMMTEYPSLDGKYSGYGRLLAGYDTLDLIANAKGAVSPRDGTVRPATPQQVLHTTVLKAL